MNFVPSFFCIRLNCQLGLVLRPFPEPTRPPPYNQGGDCTTDRLDEIQSAIETLARDLRRVEARLEKLEAAQGLADEPPEPKAPPGGAGGPAAPHDQSSGTVTLTGRTLVALGGAFLIRAMTDAGVLPALGGVALGLVYGLFWLAAASRAAGAGHRTSAGFYGLTSGLIAYPLLWETTTRFRLLSPPLALALLVLVFVAGIAVTARRGLGSVAWVVTFLALGTAAGLLVSTRHLLPSVLALLAIAGVVELLAYHDLWPALRWPAALVLDGGLLVLVVLGSRPQGLPEGYPSLSLGAFVLATLGLPALYVVSIVARTLVRGCPVTAFEMAQGGVALTVGLEGSWELLAAHGRAAPALGILSLLLGASAYSAAFAFVERRTGHGRNFYFYSTVGALLTLAGGRALLEGVALSLTWCGLALTSAWLGRRFARLTLRFHGTLYTVAAALATDALGASGSALLAPMGRWQLPALTVWIAATTAVAGYAILATDPGRSSRWWERLPQAGMAAIWAWIAGGTLVALIVVFGPTSASAPAVVATLRTGVLALLAVALGWAARRWALAELTWLVHPLLAIGGLKLVAEDLREGRPDTLFLSLVLYGGALIAAPRLMRRGD